MLVTAKQVAAACGVHYKAVVCMARAGKVPFVMQAGKMLFDEDLAVPVVKQRGLCVEGGLRRCATCGVAKSRDCFLGAKRNSVDCNECSKAKKRAAREAAAAAKGKPYRRREDIARTTRAAREERRREQEERNAARWELRMREASVKSNADALVCRTCRLEKPRDAFYPSLLTECIECRKKKDADRFQQLKRDEDAYERRLRNPTRRLRNRVGGRMREALLSTGSAKPFGVFRHLPYTLDELRTHLERTFLPGMTWQNMHLWHIDHIVPVAAFECTSVDSPDFKRCWALSNLRAAWATDNLSKGASREYLL